MWIAYRFFLFCVSVGLRFWFSIRFEGRENIPHGGGYIIASTTLPTSIPCCWPWGMPHPINYMGKAELFQNPFRGAVPLYPRDPGGAGQRGHRRGGGVCQTGGKRTMCWAFSPRGPAIK